MMDRADHREAAARPGGGEVGCGMGGSFSLRVKRNHG